MKKHYKQFVSVFVAVLLILTGTCSDGLKKAGATDNNPISDLIDEDNTEVDPLLELSVVLAFKEGKEKAYRQMLKEDGCKEENLSFCASFLYALELGSMGFGGWNFPNHEKTILGNYVSEKQVYEFGRTGKVPKDVNFEVIYFKDENGNNTNIPAVAYVVNPEVNKLGLSEVEECISSWIERGATNFLEAMVANDAIVLFQSQANNDRNFVMFTYGNNIIYCNHSGDSAPRFQRILIKALAVEQFGTRGNSFVPEFDLTAFFVSVLKSRLALECTLYLKEMNGSDEMIDGFIRSFHVENDDHMSRYWQGKSEEEFEELVDFVKENNLMVPFVPATWEEIDAVLAGVAPTE